MRRIAVVTGSRAEYGLLSPLINCLNIHPDYDCQLLVCGMHLLDSFGNTVEAIKAKRINLAAEIDILLANDTPEAITKSVGLALIEFASQFKRLKPDLVVLLGDRFEIFAAAQAAFIAHIPIAHLHGGELTLGAQDESFRHAVTKLSHLHFTACETYKNRVIQLGEMPHTVFNVGAIGLDNINDLPIKSPQELAGELGIQWGEVNFLIGLHPATINASQTHEQVNCVLQALQEYPQASLIFTKSNADERGRSIGEQFDVFCQQRDNAYCFSSLGSLNYLSVLRHVDCLIGNSSSGIIEAPYCGTPTINIGDRQQGRLQVDTIINTKFIVADIIKAIEKSMDSQFCVKVSTTRGLFGEGGTANAIINILNDTDFCTLHKKEFWDVKHGYSE